MSENPKLDPATLTATVQEVFPPPPALAGWLAFYYDSGGVIADDRGWYCTGKAHATREEALCDLAAFRPFEGSALVKVGQASALFAPAPEKAVCPNCKRDDTGHSWKVNGELRYSCNGWNKPAQPEPAAPVTGSTPISEYDPDMKPAAPEMPEAVRDVLQYLRFTSGTVANDRADALESWWRTHSQPVAVGMTEELSMVLLRAEYGATEDERNPNLRDGYVARLKDAIAAVRQQAAQGKPKVELPKVGIPVPVDALKRACATCSLDDCMTIAGWLDAVEGRK